MYIKWRAQVLIIRKKIIHSFDIDAAMVGSIYGTRIAGLSPRVTIKILFAGRASAQSYIIGLYI